MYYSFNKVSTKNCAVIYHDIGKIYCGHIAQLYYRYKIMPFYIH